MLSCEIRFHSMISFKKIQNESFIRNNIIDTMTSFSGKIAGELE